MGWEIIYIVSGILILPVLIWAIIAYIGVNYSINKYKKVTSSRGMTARELALKVASEEGLAIAVEETSSYMGDHYDPKAKTVRLTSEIIDSSSISALAIAAHECGHALQDKESYAPLKVRQVVVGASNIASRLLLPLIVFSVIVSAFTYTASGFEFMKWIMIVLCAIYGISAIANLITLPVEFDASNRAKKILMSMNILTDEEEIRGVKKVLNAAAQTYVVAFAVSLIYFLRMLASLMIVLGKRK